VENTVYKRIYLEYIKSNELDIEIFIKLFNNGYNSNLKIIERKVERLKTIYKDNGEVDIDDMVSNDYEEIMVTPKYFYCVCCIILYSNLEKKLKGILENIFDCNASNGYKFKEMKKIFAKNGIDLTNINNYKYIDELRILNNCIKHDDRVSLCLEVISNVKYKNGDVITVSEEDILVYSGRINIFLNDLYNNIQKQFKKTNGA
jgi:hypothetical protein